MEHRHRRWWIRGDVGGARARAPAPHQSARLSLVNDVNFMLYTPFLPEAAAGTLEPRHVVTPLRDILRRTYLRVGAVTGHDPEARTVTLSTHEGDDEEIRYDQFLVALGSVSLASGPGLSQHAIGFKSLADAIWLRNHVVESLERANATDDPARREAPHLRVRGRRLLGARGARRAPGLRRRRDPALPARPPARHALDPGGGHGPGAARGGPAAGRVRDPRAPWPRDRRPPRDPLEEAGPDFATLSTGERIPTTTIVWTAGVAPQPSLRNLSLPVDETGRVKSTSTCGWRHAGRLGRRRLCRGAGPAVRRRRACPPTARHAVRQGPVAAHNIAAELGSDRARPVHVQGQSVVREPGRYKAVGQLAKQRFRGFPAWWMARTTTTCRRCRGSPAGPGCRRLDGRPAVRPRRGRGRLDRPPHPLKDEVYARGGTHRPVE